MPRPHNPNRRKARSRERAALRVTGRELATILAALRFHQAENLQGGRDIPDQFISQIATDCGLLKPLGFQEVDKLCERLNTQENQSAAKGLVLDPPHKEGGDEPLYRVVYVIDVNAANPRGAAEYVRQVMMDLVRPDSCPPVLEVIDHRGKVVSVDLSQGAPA